MSPLTQRVMMLLSLLVPLGVVDPLEQQSFKRRDSFRHGAAVSRTGSEARSATPVGSPVTPHSAGMPTAQSHTCKKTFTKYFKDVTEKKIVCKR